MEMEIEENQASHRPDLNQINRRQSSTKPKGGLLTMPFIIGTANEGFERMARYGLQPNMIFYLTKEYRLGVTRATNLMFYWNAATNFTPIVGAFVADSYLGRFLTIALGSIASLLGTVLLWVTAMVSRARPPPCSVADELVQRCKGAFPGQYTLLLSSFGLMSIGAGGIRPCSLAFGADQLDRRGTADNERVLESFFGWYYAATSVSILIALTILVYIQEHMGWKVGFGVPAMLMLLSTALFLAAFSLYIKHGAEKSLLKGFLQVMVVAYKNRELELPPCEDDDDSKRYHYEKGSAYITPSRKLRFLNKACIIKSPRDVTPPRVSTDNWNLCTTDQVEELKALIKVLPIWSTGIMIAINTSQGSFLVLQANSMDRHLTPSFQIPAGSFSMFVIVTLTMWVILYDRVVLPMASRIAGRKVHLSVMIRMGIGIFLSCMAMTLSGMVEHIRREMAIAHGLANDPLGPVNMSALWLIPQHCLTGLAEAFFAIGQLEFYYSEFPKSMSSVASSLFGVGMGVGSLLASVVLNAVNRATHGSGGSGEGWASDNINKGHYDFYYWVLAGMTFVNLLYFVGCAWAYGQCLNTTHKKVEVN